MAQREIKYPGRDHRRVAREHFERGLYYETTPPGVPVPITSRPSGRLGGYFQSRKFGDLHGESNE